MKSKQSSPGPFVNILSITKAYYYECSEITRVNFKRLGLSLFFTVMICGSVLAASFCEFWLMVNTSECLWYFLELLYFTIYSILPSSWETGPGAAVY